MSTLKLGDRVHVEFDGEVLDPLGQIGDGRCLVYVGGTMADTVALPESVCTVIVPPVKVGDTVTADNIERLPEWSIIAAEACGARTKIEGLWRPCNPHDHPVSDRQAATFGAVVLRVGRAS